MARQSLLLIVMLLAGYRMFSFAQSSSIRFIDEGGKALAQAEVVVQSGGLYLTIDALRGAFDPDLKQQYSALTKRLTLNLKGKQIRLRIDRLSVTIDPDEGRLSLSRPPLTIEGQRMLPLEFFTELIPQVYDFEVFYNPALQTIHIKEKTAPLPSFPSLSSPAQQAEFLVIVDPGHGGADTGCRGSTGVLEKDIVLDLAKQIAEVSRQNQIRVLLTRDADLDRRPTERIDIANRNQGKLFLSLHCNASFSMQAEGIHLYVNNPRGELQSGGPLMDSDETSQNNTIIQALSQEDFLMQSRQFAAILQKELALLSPSLILFTEVPLATLSGVYMPAVVVEIGYLSNETDETRLTDADNVASMAAAILQAIQIYITESHQVGEAVNGE